MPVEEAIQHGSLPAYEWLVGGRRILRRNPGHASSSGPETRRRHRLIRGVLIRGVPIQELEDIGLVDAGEAAGRQCQQDVRMRSRGRPCPAFPPCRESGWRTLAAVGVRARRRHPDLGVPAAEPTRVLVRDAECDGKTTFPALIYE